MNRLAKQIIIAGIFLAIVAVPAWFLYRAIFPAATCSDGIQNNDEEGVDCGVIACGIACPPAILPLQQRPPIIIQTGPSSADILVHLENPNTLYGVSRVDYTLAVSDASGNSLATRQGFTYVDPMQPRYLVFPLTGLSGIPATAELQFTPANVQWGAFSVETAADVQFAVHNDMLTSDVQSERYEGVVTNRSSFDFDVVDVVILLHNASGDIVGVNSTVLHTLKAGEQRAFVATWPFTVPGAAQAEVIVTTNLFANSNFIKTYGSQERFQGY